LAEEKISLGNEKIGKAEDSHGLFFLPPCLFFRSPGKAEEKIGLGRDFSGKAEDSPGQIFLFFGFFSERSDKADGKNM